jgi:hypothetical protein
MDELQAVSEREYAYSTQIRHTAVKAWFQEYMQDNLPKQVSRVFYSF